MKNKVPLLFVLSIAVTVAITISGTLLITPEIFVQAPDNSLGATPEGTFYWPRDVAVNSTGFIFVADTQNSRGQIFTSSGDFVSTFGFPGNDATDASLNQPFGIFINGTGDILVADTFTNVIKHYSHNGSFNSTIGITGGGTGTDEYYYPSGITQNDTHFFIADTFNNRIIITDLSGNTEDTIP